MFELLYEPLTLLNQVKFGIFLPWLSLITCFVDFLGRQLARLKWRRNENWDLAPRISQYKDFFFFSFPTSYFDV